MIQGFAEIHWNATPELVQLGPITLRWYGLLFAAGFVIGFGIMRRVFAREGRPQHDLETLLTWMVVCSVVGARLGHCLFYDPDHYLAHPIEILKVWKGGLASHGGAIAILIGLWFYARKRPQQPYLWVCDRMAIPTALAGAFIRLGNLFNSEIVGLPTDRPWGFVFERLRDGTPRHPAQLYESLSYLFIFVVLMLVYRRLGARTPRGLIAGLFMVLVFGARFLIEFVKVRQAAWGLDLPLSVGQMLSIPAVLFGFWLMATSRRRGPA